MDNCRGLQSRFCGRARRKGGNVSKSAGTDGRSVHLLQMVRHQNVIRRNRAQGIGRKIPVADAAYQGVGIIPAKGAQFHRDRVTELQKIRIGQIRRRWKGDRHVFSHRLAQRLFSPRVRNLNGADSDKVLFSLVIQNAVQLALRVLGFGSHRVRAKLFGKIRPNHNNTAFSLF